MYTMLLQLRTLGEKARKYDWIFGKKIKYSYLRHSCLCK